MTPYIPDLRKKQVVTAQSLEKIEDSKSSFKYKWFYMFLIYHNFFIKKNLS